MQLVADSAKKLTGSAYRYYIGVTDLLSDNVHRYETNNEHISMEIPWHSGHPQSGKQCVAFSSSSNKWSEVPCTGHNDFIICEAVWNNQQK